MPHFIYSGRDKERWNSRPKACQVLTCSVVCCDDRDCVCLYRVQDLPLLPRKGAELPLRCCRAPLLLARCPSIDASGTITVSAECDAEHI